MLAVHRGAGTWRNAVNAYVALSSFAKRKLAAGGIPEDRLFVKPNCLRCDPGMGKHEGGFAIFVGRLSSEKGIGTLLNAWYHLSDRKLIIVGDGPLRPQVELASAQNSNIQYIESQPNHAVLDLLGSAAFVIVPSECYENCPRIIMEAFAKGTPVVGSRVGSIEELIEHGHTGLLFRVRNAHDLAWNAERLFAKATELSSMSAAARDEFESKYSVDRNYEQLMAIYRFAGAVSRETDGSQLPLVASISS
jgi:glycosyltransferase involved in cell wall biosynthesis